MYILTACKKNNDYAIKTKGCQSATNTIIRPELYRLHTVIAITTLFRSQLKLSYFSSTMSQGPRNAFLYR